jgi:hypothetical protein
MKIKFVGELDIPDEDISGHCDVDHELLYALNTTYENVDDCFTRLKLHWSVMKEKKNKNTNTRRRDNHLRKGKPVCKA